MDKKQEFILALFAKDEIRFLTDEALRERVKQYEHIYEVMMEALAPPPWKDAPAWAQWTAQDEDGEWFWYEKEPTLSEGCGVWVNSTLGKCVSAPSTDKNPNCANTLERRP